MYDPAPLSVVFPSITHCPIELSVALYGLFNAKESSDSFMKWHPQSFPKIIAKDNLNFDITLKFGLKS